MQPEQEEAERQRRVRAAHLEAAARAQAAAALRARANADARTPTWSEAERTGAYAGLVTRTIAYCLDIAVINVVAFLRRPPPSPPR